MREIHNQQLSASIKDFHLPAYDEIPNVGLYLDQTTKYINDYLAPLQDVNITSSMISNYIKKGLIANPVKKQYTREQIAYLFFIAIAKNVLSLENIKLAVQVQQQTYEFKVAYNYFCMELENMLQYTFGLKDTLDTIGVDDNDEKTMFRNVIIAVSHKVYLDTYFHSLSI